MTTKQTIFNRDLGRFKQESAYFEQYQDFEIVHDNMILVRVFEFNPPENNPDSPLITDVMVEFDKQTGTLTSGITYTGSKIMPYVKIIKVSANLLDHPTVKAGGVYSVEQDEVSGTQYTQDYMTLLQFNKSQGLGAPVLPEGMQKKVPNIEVKWGRYMFIRPGNVDVTPEDRLTYCIPVSKLKMKI